MDLQPFIKTCPDDGQQIVVVPRLLHVVKNADLVDGANGVLLVRISIEQYNGTLRIERAHFEQELHTVELRHQKVRYDQVDRVHLGQLQRARRRGLMQDLVRGLQFQQG